MSFVSKSPGVLNILWFQAKPHSSNYLHQVAPGIEKKKVLCLYTLLVTDATYFWDKIWSLIFSRF